MSIVEIAVDSGLPISLIFEKGRQFSKRVRLLLDDTTLKLPMLITSSVDRECRKKIDEAANRLADLERRFWRFLNRQFVSRGKAEIDGKDAFHLQRYFSDEIVNQTEERGKEEIRLFETAVISELRKQLDTTSRLTVASFIDIIGQWTTQLYSDYNDEYDALKKRYWQVQRVDPAQELIEFMHHNTGINNWTDLRHIASALVYSLREDRWVIFCSLDYRDLVGTTAFEKLLVYVSDPAYVRFCHQRLTDECKGKRPRQYMAEKSRPIPEHVMIAYLVQKHHGINITLRLPRT